MSSYISSVYQLERQRRLAIVGQCQQELRQAEQAAAQNRAAWRAMLEQRARQQRQLATQEQSASDEATAQILRADAQRKVRQEQVQRLLQHAAEEVRRCEAHGVNGELRERLQTMQTHVSLFGASREIQQRLEHFLQEEIPQAREEVRQAAEQRRIEKALAQEGLMRRNVKDESMRFVSLQTEKQAKAKIYTSPWQVFIQRLENLRVQQEPMGENRAGEILKQAKAVAPEQQNLFLLNHRAEVDALEQNCAELQDACRRQQEQAQQLQDRYLALCMLCQVRPSLPEDAADNELEQECTTLMTRYQKEKERQYITNSFSEVLESFGIDFESLDTDANGQMQMQYHISAQAALRVTRSDAGAFEMQFTGITEDAQASQNEKRQVVEQAHSFCKRLPEIAAALRERGILFDQVAVQQPTEESVVMVSTHQKSRFSRTQKEREMP